MGFDIKMAKRLPLPWSFTHALWYDNDLMSMKDYDRWELSAFGDECGQLTEIIAFFHQPRFLSSYSLPELESYSTVSTLDSIEDRRLLLEQLAITFGD